MAIASGGSLAIRSKTPARPSAWIVAADILNPNCPASCAASDDGFRKDMMIWLTAVMAFSVLTPLRVSVATMAPSSSRLTPAVAAADDTIPI